MGPFCLVSNAPTDLTKTHFWMVSGLPCSKASSLHMQANQSLGSYPAPSPYVKANFLKKIFGKNKIVSKKPWKFPICGSARKLWRHKCMARIDLRYPSLNKWKISQAFTTPKWQGHHITECMPNRGKPKLWQQFVDHNICSKFALQIHCGAKLESQSFKKVLWHSGSY